jgi:hypothetical protein
MPRFIDDLRAPGARVQMPMWIAPQHEKHWLEHTLRVNQALQNPDLPVLLIDNVSDYYYTASDQEYWDLSVHFPNLAPPYKQFWCEHRLPKIIHSKEAGDSTQPVPNGRCGMYFAAMERNEFKGEGVPDNVKWIYWCELFIDYCRPFGVTADGSHGPCFFAVDAEGRLVDRPWMQSFTGGHYQDMMQKLMTWFNVGFLAVSFLHCKNVRLDDNRVPAPLVKKYKARHGVEPCAYKTLVIEPLKQILRQEGRSNEVGIAKALHICRGHFRDYREGRGLFGKYHQLVWTPSVIRGTKGTKAPAREIKVKV